MAMLRELPTLWATTELKRLQHENPARPWVPQDHGDLIALTMAIVHCDIVVFDKHWTALARRADLEDGQRHDLVPLRELPTDLMWRLRPDRDGAAGACRGLGRLPRHGWRHARPASMNSRDSPGTGGSSSCLATPASTRAQLTAAGSLPYTAPTFRSILHRARTWMAGPAAACDRRSGRPADYRVARPARERQGFPAGRHGVPPVPHPGAAPPG